MKKSIKTLILTALLVMAGSLSAQSLINGGFDYMQLRVGDNKPANYPGFHVGAATNVALSKHIGVTPGIFFSRHTADNKTAVAGITHHSKYTESTVNIPVLPNVRLYLSEISYFYIFAGPEFNIGVSAKSDNWVDGLDAHLEKNYYDDKTVSASEEMRRYNISIMFGIGFKLDFVNITLGATGNLFNQHYKNDIDQKAYRAFASAGFVF